MVAVTVERLIASYLDRLNLPYKHSPQRKLFIIQYVSKSGREIPVMIYYSNKWIKFFVIAYNENDIPAYIDRKILYRRLLEENFYTYGVTFGITEKGSIIVEREVSTSSLRDVEIFRMYILSVLSGMNYFIKEILKL